MESQKTNGINRDAVQLLCPIECISLVFKKVIATDLGSECPGSVPGMINLGKIETL